MTFDRISPNAYSATVNFAAGSQTDNSGTDSQTDNSASDGQRRKVGERWEKFCPGCEEWIGLGPSGGERPFLFHRSGKRCKHATERRIQREAKEALESVVPPPTIIPPSLPSGSSHPFTTHPSLATGLVCEDDSHGNLPPDPQSHPLSQLLDPPYSPAASALPSLVTLTNTSTSPSPLLFPFPPLSDDVPTMSSSTDPTSSQLLPDSHHDVSQNGTVTIDHPCNGVSFKWEHRSGLFLTYPLQYHHTGHTTWSLDGVGEPSGSHMVRIRSHLCTGHRDPLMEACPPCTNVISSQPFQNMLKNVQKDPSPNTPYLYLNWEQLATRVKLLVKELQAERKQVCSLVKSMFAVLELCFQCNTARKKNQQLTRRLDDYERLCYHISVSDYKNVNLVLRTSLKNGSSPNAIVAKLQLAIEKEFSPRPGVDERTLDVGYLVQAIGGPRLLFILNRFFGLPSFRTIGHHRTVPQLIPSILSPSRDEVSKNISTFFNQNERPASSTAGHALLIDGVALDEKCRWFRLADSIIGLCREHAGNLDLRVRSLQSITSIQDALCEDTPRAHYASEATVVAIAPFRSSNYSAIPLALSGSCKAENGNVMAGWLGGAISAWKEEESGESLHGPIWSIATDGESTMRTCRFYLCMSQTLSTSENIHPLLKNLTGLNLRTGEGNITMTCDPKHIFKRKSVASDHMFLKAQSPGRFRNSLTKPRWDLGQPFCGKQKSHPLSPYSTP